MTGRYLALEVICARTNLLDFSVWQVHIGCGITWNLNIP